MVASTCESSSVGSWMTGLRDSVPPVQTTPSAEIVDATSDVLFSDRVSVCAQKETPAKSPYVFAMLLCADSAARGWDKMKVRKSARRDVIVVGGSCRDFLLVRRSGLQERVPRQVLRLGLSEATERKNAVDGQKM